MAPPMELGHVVGPDHWPHALWWFMCINAGWERTLYVVGVYSSVWFARKLPCGLIFVN